MANYSIKVTERQARFLRRMLENLIYGQGPDPDGYYHLRSEEDDEDVYLSEEDLDNLYLEVEKRTSQL